MGNDSLSFEELEGAYNSLWNNIEGTINRNNTSFRYWIYNQLLCEFNLESLYAPICCNGCEEMKLFVIGSECHKKGICEDCYKNSILEE